MENILYFWLRNTEITEIHIFSLFSYFDKLSIQRGDTFYTPAAVVSNYLTLAWPLLNTINIDNNKIVSFMFAKQLQYLSVEISCNHVY